MDALPTSRLLLFAGIACVVALIGIASLRSGGDGAGRTDAFRPAAERAGGSAGDGAGAGLQISSAAGSAIFVDVSGAVRDPGVYRMRHGQRVIDVIRRAGGATRKAAAEGINRAALLSDGQQVVVPLRAGAATVAGGSPAPGAVSAALPDAPISLGTATVEQLDQIEGIGPVTAQSIIEFRDSQGGLASVEDLDQVKGIGPVTMEALRARLQP